MKKDKADLREGEFYVWKDENKCGFEICHTDCDERIFEHVNSSEYDTEQVVKKMNTELKSRNEPVYYW